MQVYIGRIPVYLRSQPIYFLPAFLVPTTSCRDQETAYDTARGYARDHGFAIFEMNSNPRVKDLYAPVLSVVNLNAKAREIRYLCTVVNRYELQF
jgi:hypothetical protein